MKCQIHSLHLEQYFILKNIIYIYDIYVSIAVSLFKLVYIIWGRGNIQHLMLANNYYNKITIAKYYQKYGKHLC